MIAITSNNVTRFGARFSGQILLTRLIQYKRTTIHDVDISIFYVRDYNLTDADKLQ